MTSSIDYDLEMIETFTQLLHQMLSLFPITTLNRTVNKRIKIMNPIVRKRTDRFEPERFAFDSNDFEISLDFQGTDESSALYHFCLIFDNDFMAKILEETTRYNLSNTKDKFI